MNLEFITQSAEAEVTILWILRAEWENLRASGEGGNRRWDGITDTMDNSLSQLREIVKDREALCAAVHRVTKSLKRLSDQATTMIQSEVSQKEKNKCLILMHIYGI